MRRGTKLGVVILALMVSGVLLMAVTIMRHGVSARNNPTTVEAFLARRLRHLAIPLDDRGHQNPTPRTEEVLAEARAHFADHCALCHGNDGKGQTTIGRG